MSARAHAVVESGGKSLIAFHCPGCRFSHVIDTNTWTWNGSLDLPTFQPSVLVQRTMGNDRFRDDPLYEEHEERCHSFVTDGRIQFLGDCTHALANQTVDLPDWDAES